MTRDDHRSISVSAAFYAALAERSAATGVPIQRMVGDAVNAALDRLEVEAAGRAPPLVPVRVADNLARRLRSAAVRLGMTESALVDHVLLNGPAWSVTVGRMRGRFGTAPCPVCAADRALRTDGTLRVHRLGDGTRCPASEHTVAEASAMPRLVIPSRTVVPRRLRLPSPLRR